MRRALAGLLTLVLMAFLLWSGARRGPDPSPADEARATPAPAARPADRSPAEGRVRDLLAAAAEGDVPAYLDSFAEPLRGRLAREVEGRGREAFAADLKSASLARKGHAVFAAEPDGPAAALVTVESVYPDRNERQTYRVEQTPAGWLVAGVEPVKSRQPAAKYGAPAAYLAPEGPPVPGGVTVETGDGPEGP
jgi:hypothetical protein